MNAAQKNGSGESVVGSLTGFASDIASLIELQFQLFAADFKDLSARAVPWLAILAVGFIVLLGSVPVLIGGVGLLLAVAFGISNGLGLLLSAIGAMILAGIGLVAAVNGLRRSLETLQRSREELERNVAWIRTVVLHSGRPVPRRRW